MSSIALSTFIGVLKKKELWVSGEASGDFLHLISDTRQLSKPTESKSTLFFARKGPTRDGHEFLSELHSDAAIGCFVVERIPSDWKPSLPVILVKDSTAAMATAAKIFYGDPSSQAFTSAVTGTNGKTTTTFLLQALMAQMGLRAGRMGTIETEFEGMSVPAELTTPDFSQIQKIFSEFKAKGASSFVFEASSHALNQGRLQGLELDAAIFTNLTPEHLDYHRTMENYYLAKRNLFLDLLSGSQKKRKFAVIPDDGSFGSRLADEVSLNPSIELIRWAHLKKAVPQTRFILESWKTDLNGSSLRIIDLLKAGKHTFQSKLVGGYNVENLMGMISLGLGLDLTPIEIQFALDRVKAIPGRLEKVTVDAETAHIFVDYAHTPDALENVLMTLRPLTKGKLKAVFGCGGDRDRAKRPKMGAIAELYCDEIFVTSDNPRTEDPDSIIQEILNGLQRIKPVHIDADRKQAIRKSMENLSPDDVVLIAGKGHENYQILGTQKINFDDREVARNYLGNK